MKQFHILSIALISMLTCNSALSMDKKKLQLVLSEAPSEQSQPKSFYGTIQKDTTALTFSNEQFIQYLSDNFKIHPILIRHDEDGVSDKSCCLGKEKKLNEASRRILGMIIQAKTLQQECTFKSNLNPLENINIENSNVQEDSNIENLEANLPILMTAQRAITERYITVKNMKWLDTKNK